VSTFKRIGVYSHIVDSSDEALCSALVSRFGASVAEMRDMSKGSRKKIIARRMKKFAKTIAHSSDVSYDVEALFDVLYDPVERYLEDHV